MKCNLCDADSVAVVKDTYGDIQVCEEHLEFYIDLGLTYKRHKNKGTKHKI